MALNETLLLTVGPAIAKAVLKLWLKDRSFASNVSVALVDILGAKTADIMAQRDGKRKFEAIGDRVAQSLSPLFERDGASIEEGERNAVALTLAETLDKTPLDAEFLVKKDLQPTHLAKHLLDSRPDATRGLSQKGTDLYRRAISETSQRIVDIASQFPSFTERSFGEVLKRENELLDIVKRILEAVSRIRESSQKANLEASAAQFEETYRLAVARNLDNMDLQGADLSATSRRYSLSVAYITLSAKTDSNAEGGKEGSVSRSMPAHEALAGASRLLIRGMAGSGKTTLLKWVAVHSASHSFEGPLSDWNDAVPFFVRLRKCADKELPKPEEMPGLVAPAISNTMPQGWVHEQLKSGRGIILVDGLDEIREEKRRAVEIWIRDLLNAYKDARVLVTARHHAADSGWLSQEGFHEAELQPMEPADIFKFIEHWHAAIEQGLHGTTEKEELAEMKSRMLATVREKRSLRSLATSPLLCAMLCALNRDRKAQLPTDRIRLYDACCEMLVERREIERQVDLRDYPPLEYRDKRALLEDLAYWMLDNGWSEVEFDEAVEQISRKLEGMPRVPTGTTGLAVCKYLIERSGIIREPVQGVVDFTHRTFQEYLAAQAAVDKRNIGVLVKNATDDQWREVIVLAAGLADQAGAEQLIGGLIGSLNFRRSTRHQFHLLAVACLETAVSLSRPLMEKVRQRLATLIPPKNARDVKALAGAGDLAVQFLGPNAKHTADEAALCIRTLTLIGSNEALEVLRHYASDSGEPILKEIAGAMDSFGQQDCLRVLADCHSVVLHWLAQCPRLSSLEGFEHLTWLESLDFFGTAELSDLSPLSGLKNLKELRLWGCRRVTNFDPLQSLPCRESYIRMPESVIIPDSNWDQHGNQIAIREGRRTDPATSWPFEIWLDQPRIEFVLIPEGKFLIGSEEGEPHTVVFEKPFYLAKYALTRKQYAQLAGKNPSHFKDESCPVESVSWDDSVTFCKKLSQMTCVDIGLPSEAQWEYACRAGSTGLWCFGSDESQLPRYAWYDKNSGGKTHPVGQKEPNDWSLYDMHGNVWEWCEDAWHDSYKGVPSDGSAWKDGADEKDVRVLRGGSWSRNPNDCRASYRGRLARALGWRASGCRISLRDL